MKREGFCACGCGGHTALAPKTDRRMGYVKGHPKPYILNHDKRRPLAGYVVEDRGYATPCHIWQGSIRRNGYGGLCDPETGESTTAHAWYWRKSRGAVPSGKELDHLCRVRSCCNIEHLEPVTRLTNVHRGNATKLTDEQVLEIAASAGPALPIAERFGVTRQHVYQLRSGTARRKAVCH